MGAVSPNSILRPAGEIVRREIAGETILVPVRGRTADMRRIFSLNPTAAFLWERLDGTRRVSDLLADLLEAFEVSPEDARADLGAFLDRAVEEGLLEPAP